MLKLGRVPWDILAREEKEAGRRALTGASTLICCEPCPTYTAGRSARDAELLWDRESCEAAGIAVRRANRGGRWTYHGPGQLVVYPISSLDSLGLHSKATRLYMDRFREAVCAWLTEIGIEPHVRSDRPFGIYCEDRKLAAFGVRFDGGVTQGGVAVYLTDQNPGFRGLIPCGVQGETMTSLQQQGVSPDWESAVDGLAPFLKEGLKPRERRLTFVAQEESHERQSRIPV